MMKHFTTNRAMGLVVIILLLAVSTTLAETGSTSALPVTSALLRTGSASFDLSWFTVDGGGGSSGGGPYTLSGTIGQPDAGVLSDGDYTLAGGFWGGGGAVQYCIYLPLVLRNY